MCLKKIFIYNLMSGFFFIAQLQAGEAVSAQKTVDFLNKYLANSKDTIYLSDNKIFLDSYSKKGKAVIKVDPHYISESLQINGLTDWGYNINLKCLDQDCVTLQRGVTITTQNTLLLYFNVTDAPKAEKALKHLLKVMQKKEEVDPFE